MNSDADNKQRDTIAPEGRQRVVIENVKPEVGAGRYPAKRVPGEKVVVEADIFADGHDELSAVLLFMSPGEDLWRETAMKPVGNDRWRGEFPVKEIGRYAYTIRGWVDHFGTWRKDIRKKFDAGQDLSVDIRIGLGHVAETLASISGDARQGLQRLHDEMKEKASTDIAAAVEIATGEELAGIMAAFPDARFAVTYDKELSVMVDHPKALFSTWYELFPRSCPRRSGSHGTFRDCENILPEIARMGFDVLYLPPIHPIGRSKRKGKNNSPECGPEDVGSPWAIGSEEGGHTAIHGLLGAYEDFERLIAAARDNGIDIAMDLAFQCSPDHPYVRDHPAWFRSRPDGTIQYAENPPKKYEDIVPLNFETGQWQELWEELKGVVLFWIEKGVRIFRVDNPHTKSFHFWERLIAGVKEQFPEVFFLSEAFTRPKIMYRLGKIGFSQSYTYFTWRYTQKEFRDYLTELTRSDVREFFRPNFWPNTPDILTEHLQYGGRPAFMMRLVLAATLSPSYGIYGPAFELCDNVALPGKEEYLNSEKYEIRTWDWDRPGNLKDLIARVNRIRRENAALQRLWNLTFCDVDNENILFYVKATEDLSNVLLVVINLDPFHTHSGWVRVPITELGIADKQPYLVHDLLSDDKYIWQGDRNYVELDPQVLPANIFRVRKHLKRETDFDYFM
jgi:starch synthase (maltosyl-transferring)